MKYINKCPHCGSEDITRITGNNHKIKDIVSKVFSRNQSHVFQYWDELREDERDKLIEDVRYIDFDLIERLKQEYIFTDKKETVLKLEPPDVISVPKTDKDREAMAKAEKTGAQAIKDGRLAVFLVAGGQGTRLGFDGPKGAYPVTPVRHNTLFQLHAGKIIAASKRYNVKIPWYIMTSSTNHEDTVSFFRQNNFFGIAPGLVHFFQQAMIPSIDEKGELMLETKSGIFKNPNGHGGSLLALNTSGALDEMKAKGIRHIFYFQVDNPLCNILDPVFIGYHILNKAEMSSKVVAKAGPEEKVGVIGYINGKLGVVEYSDMSKEDMYAKDEKGNLKYNAGNIAVHMLDVDFVKKENKGGLRLPYHKAVKDIKTVNGAIKGIKFETFVFDALKDTTASVVMEVLREEDFAPVKNKEGVDSPESSRILQNQLFARWLRKAGIRVPEAGGIPKINIEISPLFALDEGEFAKKLSQTKYPVDTSKDIYIE